MPQRHTWEPQSRTWSTGAPLNTLSELAVALGNDANFSTSTAAVIGTKAPLNSPTFTGTVSGITAAMVGLGNVNNTSDLNKPISTAVQSALTTYQALITSASNISVNNISIGGSLSGTGVNTLLSPYALVTALSSYQLVSGMSNYLTTSSAASTYQPLITTSTDLATRNITVNGTLSGSGVNSLLAPYDLTSSLTSNNILTSTSTLLGSSLTIYTASVSSIPLRVKNLGGVDVLTVVDNGQMSCNAGIDFHGIVTTNSIIEAAGRISCFGLEAAK